MLEAVRGLRAGGKPLHTFRDHALRQKLPRDRVGLVGAGTIAEKESAGLPQKQREKAGDERRAGESPDDCASPWSQCVASCNSPSLAPPPAAP